MFAVSATQQIAGHQAQKKAVKARNKYKLANCEIANDQYEIDVMLEKNKWKNSVQDADVAIDNLFTSVAYQWQQQDIALEEAAASHAWNKNEIIREMYKNEYAGEATGVTASRLAGEDVRKAGFALTKSMSDLVMNRDKAWIAKETARIEGNQKRRAQWSQIWRSPVPGHTPRPPELEREPGMGGLILNLAISAALAYVGGTQAAKAAKAGKGIKGAALAGKSTVFGQGATEAAKQSLSTGFAEAAKSGTSILGSAGYESLNFARSMPNAFTNLSAQGATAFQPAQNLAFTNPEALFGSTSSFLGGEAASTFGSKIANMNVYQYMQLGNVMSGQGPIPSQFLYTTGDTA